MSKSSAQQLREYLEMQPAGAIADPASLEGLLAGCWNEFVGGDAEGMTPDKLHGRIEAAEWQPPVLHFSIERHGGMALGSTRAQIHGWAVNVKELRASVTEIGHKLIRSMQPRLDVMPLAKAIVSAITHRRTDERLKWNKDGSVRILMGAVLPHDPTVFKQTLAGRRKRLRQAVEQMLDGYGWKRLRTNVYAPPNAQTK